MTLQRKVKQTDHFRHHEHLSPLAQDGKQQEVLFSRSIRHGRASQRKTGDATPQLKSGIVHSRLCPERAIRYSCLDFSLSPGLQLPLSLLSSALGLASQLVGLALGLADDLVGLALGLAGELAGLALGLALDLGGGARVLRAREDVLADFLGLLGDGA